MHKRIVAGQTLNGLALVLLAGVAGWFPRVWGSYPYRPAEMLAFWLGFAMLLWGLRLTRSALPFPFASPGSPAPTPNAAGASLAVLVGVLICVFSLLNFFYTTLGGLRLLPDWLGSGGSSRLTPPGMGAAWMAVPLLITAVCQIPLGIRAWTSREAESPFAAQRPSVIYWLALAASAVLVLPFLGASLASLADRHALAVVVGATLLESLVVAFVALEQFIWSLPRTANLPPPWTGR
jgi:hypothetical protein